MTCTRTGSGPLSLVGGLALAACFSDAPPLSDDSTSDTSGDGTSSSEGTETTSVDTSDAETSGPATSTSDASTTSTSTSTADTGAGDSSTTGPVAPECGCPADAVLCEDFEDRLGSEWGFPGGGGGTGMLDASQAYCGGSSLQTRVMDMDTFAAAVGVLDTTIGEFVDAPHTARLFIWIEPACTGLPSVVQLFQIESNTGGFAYSWDIAMDGEMVLLRSYIDGTTTDSEAVAIANGEWVELRLELDYAGMQPFATLHVGGEQTIATEPALDLEGAFADAPEAPQIVLGPYYYAAPFPIDCSVWYDDVWVAPT